MGEGEKMELEERKGMQKVEESCRSWHLHSTTRAIRREGVGAPAAGRGKCDAFYPLARWNF